MKPDISDWIVFHERFNDFVREADNERLVRQVQQPRTRWDQQLAVSLGAHLVDLGARLRGYGLTPRASVPCPEGANCP